MYFKKVLFIYRFFRPLYLPVLDEIYKRKKINLYRMSRRLNKDKKILILWNRSTAMGIMSYLKIYVFYIDWAIKRGYTPVIDMKNFPNPFSSTDNENGWELFFEQPADISLEEAYNSRKVYLGTGWLPGKNHSFQGFMDIETAERKQHYRNIVKKYIVLNDTMKAKIDNYEKKIFAGGGIRVIGVYARGTDYVKNSPKGHYIQPDVNDLEKKVKEVMISNHCNRVFLATEDLEILKKFQIDFGEDLYCVDQFRFSINEGEFLPDVIDNSDIDIIELNRQYLVAMYLLTKCTCLVGGKTGGSEILDILCEKEFEYKYIFELGKYE